AKLSKRHGALGVDAYRAMGYLPAAMRNYLVRLGWAHGDQETFSTEEMIAAFDLPAIGRSPARFDFAKLENLNGHYIRASGDAELIGVLEALLPHIAGGDELAGKLTPELRAKLLIAMPGLKERAKTLIELFEASRFLWANRPLEINAAAKVLLTADAKAVVAALLPDLEANTDWSAPGVEAVVRGFAERTGAKLGAVAQPLRAALTGKTTSPPIFDVLAVLGRDESLARLRDQQAATA
ncbi:MAG: glutamate--tRNA ligase family protein, partial [Pseudolabrys sp.]|nr:glutamate--tRNA ligase family protein [Pseudolabrys sp.]